MPEKTRARLVVTVLVVAALLPFAGVAYGRALAWWIDRLSAAPHERLALLLDYVGRSGRALLEPAPAICITALVIVWLLRRELAHLVAGIRELHAGSVHIVTGPPQVGPPIEPSRGEGANRGDR